MKVYFFPGDGSQARGMGIGTFQFEPELVKKADDILGYSIRDLCLRDPDGHMRKTRYVQPAIYMVNALAYLRKIKDDPQPPDYFVGHGVGEINALYAAGAIDFETGLKIVKKRGELLEADESGSMAAVSKCDEQQLKNILKENNLDSIEIANYNSPNKFVISGSKEDIANAKKPFKSNRLRFTPIKTKSALHSSHMAETANAFGQYLDSITFSPLKVPVVSNVTAQPFEDDRIGAGLAEQLTHGIKFSQCVRYLAEQSTFEFEELTHKTVLTKLVKEIIES